MRFPLGVPAKGTDPEPTYPVRHCAVVGPTRRPQTQDGRDKVHCTQASALRQMCTYKAQTLSAKQACQDQGGDFTADQNCEVE